MTETPFIIPFVSARVHLTSGDWWSRRILPLDDNVPAGLFLFATKDDNSVVTPNPKINKESKSPSGIIIPNGIGLHDGASFNFALSAIQINKQEGQYMFLPDMFERVAAEPLLLLRLYSTGDIFTPFAIPSGFDVLLISSDYCEVESLYTLTESELDAFVVFFKRYWGFIEMVKIKGSDPMGGLGNWAKNIGNACFFFNRSYFTRISNRKPAKGRAENIVRLIHLISALEALVGVDSDATKLATSTEFLLCNLYPKVSDRLLQLYQARSSWLHANAFQLKTSIEDEEVADLRKFVQKVILINLELFAIDEIRNDFIKSQETHPINFIFRSSRARIKQASDNIIRSGQLYDRL